MIISYKEIKKNPELVTGHVYRFTGKEYKNVYFTYGDARVVYLECPDYVGGWDFASNILEREYVEVTLKEVYND